MIRLVRGALPGEDRRFVFPLVVGCVVGILAAALAVPKDRPASPVAGPAAVTAVSGTGLGVSGPARAIPAAGGPQGADPASPGAPGATAPAGASGARAPGGAPAKAGGSTQGVTGSKIRVGFAWLDLAALRYLGPSFDNGERPRHMKAIVEGLRRDGLLPVHGRDIEIALRSYDPTNPATQRAACVGLAQDEKVFAVIADSVFIPTGTECVTREFRTPLVTSDAPPDSVFARSHPYLFTLQMSQSRIFRNWVWWAHAKGFLRGKRIGLYYAADAVTRFEVQENIKKVLASLGYSVSAEVATEQTRGGPTDGVAVQRFRAAGVQVAMLLTSKQGFTQQAEAQGEKFQYLDNDYLSGTTNTASSTYAPDQFDGAYGMTGMHYGEWKVGMPPTPLARKCLGYYRAEFGRLVDPNEREAEYIAFLKICDDMTVLVKALHLAGRGLTRLTLVEALERVRDFPLAIHGDVTFSAARHHGVDWQRTVRWHADCRCWKAIGRFEPLWVP